MLEQHEAIVEAIEANDADAAAAAMQTHLRRILRFVEPARKAHPEFFVGDAVLTET